MLYFGVDGNCDLDVNSLASSTAVSVGVGVGVEVSAGKSMNANKVNASGSVLINDNIIKTSNNNNNNNAVVDLSLHLLQALKDKFGLQALVNIPVPREEDSSMLSHSLQSVQIKLHSVLDPHSGFIDWNRLFSNVAMSTSNSTLISNKVLPVKMEICSGSGLFLFFCF